MCGLSHKLVFALWSDLRVEYTPAMRMVRVTGVLHTTDPVPWYQIPRYWVPGTDYMVPSTLVSNTKVLGIMYQLHCTQLYGY
jgi:hypothetical protein